MTGLPSLLRAVNILKRPRTPIDFLRMAIAYGDNNAVKYLLHVAKILQPHVTDLRLRGRSQARRNLRKTRQQFRRRIEQLFSDGRQSAATNATELATAFLENPTEEIPSPPSTEDTIAILQQLNPAGGEADVLPAVTPEETARGNIVLDGLIVDEALRSLPSGSANGASGWTCGLIRRLYTTREGTDTQALIDFLNALASGALPHTHWTTSRAVLIPKPNSNGFRPLGIGEAWYRFLGRALLLSIGKEVGGQLKPLQLGCGVPGGCEIAARMAQVFLDENPTHVLIKTDFKNAFNLTPRSSIFRGLEKFCPKLLPWFRWAYGAPTPLVNSDGEQVGSSETGCRQGDPLAALLFCVAIQQALDDIQKRLNERFDDAVATQRYPEDEIGTKRCVVMSYMDDCTISVPWVLAEEVCTDLIEICAQHGLHLNVEKCRIIGTNVDHLPPTASFRLVRAGEIILGNPVGTPEFRAATNRDLISSFIRPLPTLDALQVNPIAAFNIIKFCVNARANYLVRVQDQDGLNCLQVFDEAVDKAIFQIAQHNPTNDNNTYRKSLSATLRSLPLVHGGLGVARYSWVPGQVGVIRSRLLLAEFINEHFSHCYSRVVTSLPGIRIGVENCPLPIDFGPAIPRAEMDDLAVINGEMVTGEIAPGQYSTMASTIIRFLAEYLNSPARAAWFRSSQFEGSGRWLTPPVAVYHDSRYTLNPNEYRVAIRQRLLLAPFEDNSAATHPLSCACGTALNDETCPFHFLDCIHNHAYNQHRHSACREVVDSFLKKKLKDRSIQTSLSPRLHSPDGTLLDLNADLAVNLLPNVSQVLDFVVSNPAAATHTNPPYLSHENDDAANTYHESDKLRHYGHTLEVQAGQLIPFAVEATGRMGPRAINWIEETIPEEDRMIGRPAKRTPVQLLHAILCTVVTKHCANVVLHHRRKAWEQHARTRAAHVSA